MTKDLSSPVASSALPKIFFTRSQDGRIQEERIKIVDRHGRDVTDLFLTKEIRFEHSFNDGHFAKARLRFRKRRWTVDDSLDISDRISVTHESGYDLLDGLGINTLEQLYPRGGCPELEITFDAEWA